MKHAITYTNYSSKYLSNVETIIQANHGLLSVYVEQLLWWNKKVNLVSRDVSHETLMKHVAHSLLISQIEVFKQTLQIIDTGSGGGLPGLPLAMCFPDKNIVLNDIVAKKMMASKQIARKVGVQNVQTKSGSIAKMDVDADTLLISKHAFKVYELVDLIKKNTWKHILFLKGEEEAVDEIRKTQGSISATITNLDHLLTDEFYKGKAIVHVIKENE